MPTEPTALPGGATAGTRPGAIVRAQGVRKTYRTGDRPVEALRGADLVVERPGFYAIMGASGSGKSTLLYLLAGLDRADAGEIEVGGERIDRMDGMPRAALADRARGLLASLGLEDRMDHRPEALSGGEQQRVAIARALLFEPSVVFADEPTGALDSANAERLWKMLDRLATERNIAVLMVTHEPAAAAHCRTVFVIRDGVVAGSFETRGMHASDLVVRASELGRAAR